MTRSEVAAVLALFAGCYPSLSVTSQMVESWAVVLAKDDGPRVMAAATRLVRQLKFPPTIADLCNAVADVEAGPDAENVLGEILGAVHEHGLAGQKHLNLSPVAALVVETMGWRNLCDSENPEALRAHVLRIAATFRRRLAEDRNLAAGGLPVPERRAALAAGGLGSDVGALLHDHRPEGSRP